MTWEAESQSLGKVTEITHIAPLKPGFVASDLAVTYAARLRKILRLLFALRRSDESAFRTPVDKLGLIHFARWTIIDDDTRLLFTTNFDGSWEAYLHAFVDTFPRLLDLIWSHCEGYPPLAADHYADFSRWVRLHQVRTDMLYASNADVTVLDIQWLKKLKTHYDAFCREVQNEGPSPSAKILLGRIRELEANVYGIDVQRPKERVEPMPLAGRDAFERLSGWFQSPEERELFERALYELDPEGRHRRQWTSVVSIEETTRAVSVSLDNIQAGILEGYPWADWARVVFLEVDEEAAPRFLKRVRNVVTTADSPGGGKPVAINFAVSYPGLRRFGLGERERESFPMEFRLGMTARAEVLRNTGMSHPSRWPGELEISRVDAVLIAHAAREHETEAREKLDALAGTAGVHTVRAETLEWPAEGHIEPFGFEDGLSQPEIVDEVPQGSTYQNAVARGEFLLGHPNDRGEVALRPSIPELRNDATYLVLEKLEQDVERFEELLDDNARRAGLSREDIAAFLMGRKRNGAALAGDEPFDDTDDPEGALCPFHAHVRLANPRRGSLPRILRRGMPYRPDSGRGKPGILFMALNASIAHQFELIQQWLNGANASGGMSTDPDPLVGTASLDAEALPPAFSFLHDGKVETLIGLDPRRPLVRLLWGLYLFVPSKRGLDYLIASRSVSPPEETSHLETVRTLEGTRQRDRVKKLLEEIGTAAVTASRLWTELRAEKELVETTYGTLVAKPEDVEAVLEDPSGSFSVREYERRMSATTGSFYLGFDDPERYALESRVPNDFIRAISKDAAAKLTRQIAQSALERTIATLGAREDDEARWREARNLELTPPPPGLRISLPRFGKDVLLRVSRHTFGIPRREETTLSGVRAVSAYIFYPSPENFGEHLAKEIGSAMAEEIENALDEPASPNTLIAHLVEAANRSETLDRDWVVRTAAGVFSGFFVPTLASFLSIFSQWHREGELERVRSRYRRRQSEDELEAAFLKALRKRPMPNLIYREATADTELPGGGCIRKGSRVVAGLGSALADESTGMELLFGAGRHACQGSEMALGVLRGMIACLFEEPRLHPAPSPHDLVVQGPFESKPQTSPRRLSRKK